MSIAADIVIGLRTRYERLWGAPRLLLVLAQQQHVAVRLDQVLVAEQVLDVAQAQAAIAKQIEFAAQQRERAPAEPAAPMSPIESAQP